MKRPSPLSVAHLNLVDESARQSGKPGTVHLVGAGPGDPELITVKALRLLQRADAVVYDRLANPDLLREVGATCELHYVGKRKDHHSLPQEHICRLLAQLATRHRTVVRLKGGDPFIFGRGGEEYDYLAARGIDCQVVPGITAATGCAAATRIPLTHRDHAHAVTFITGHRMDDSLGIHWDSVLQPYTTVVFYMGLSRLREITDELLRRGCPAERPFAVIANGTGNRQQVLIGTVADIASRQEATPVPGPALLVMGDVVRANEHAADLAAQARRMLQDSA